MKRLPLDYSGKREEKGGGVALVSCVRSGKELLCLLAAFLISCLSPILPPAPGNRMDHQPTPRSCSRGPPACEAVQSDPSMNVHIHTTTGARYELSVPLEETVEGLKRRLSQRLKVPKERLALLHKER